MNRGSSKIFGNFWRQCTAACITVVFIANSIVPVYAQSVTTLPAPGVRVGLSISYKPALLKALKVYTDNPFQFDFIIDTGDSQMVGKGLKEESNRLIKYFLAAVTTPDTDLWVNLSPYEQNKIIPPSFGKTEMGRDLLAQDYILKQITASIIYPEEQMGKKFWDKVYAEAKARYGTTDIPVNTFNKVWIIPEKSVIYENGTTAYVTETKLKVLLEQDYLTLQNNKANSQLGTNQLLESDVSELSSLSSKIVREIVIPELEKEVNTGKNFATIRQIYNSLVLAFWYKKRLKNSILSKLYTDKNKVTGVDIKDKAEAQKIYDRYIQAFKKGVYNYVREDFDAESQETIPRKYFSGGAVMTLKEGQNVEIRTVNDFSEIPTAGEQGATFSVNTLMNPGQQGIEGSQAPATTIAHVRNAERLTRILRLIARTESAALSPRSSNFEIVEFLVDRLKQSGLVEESRDDNGIVILKISQRAKEDRLGAAIYKWVMNPEEGLGTKAVNFKSSLQGPWAGQWLIVGLEEELKNERVLKHEQREVYYRRQNPEKSWIVAHNAVVEELKDGVRFEANGSVGEAGNLSELGTAIGGWFKRNKNQPAAKFEQDVEALRAQGVQVIDTDMTLDYGGLQKWTQQRILVDLVQNHKPADAKGTKVTVNFHLKDGRVLDLLDKEVQSLAPDQVDLIEIADDGIGYDVEHLKYFLTTKGSAAEGGKFGEGLKIATAAALKSGVGVEFQSRSWHAKPIVTEKIINRGFPNEIKTFNVAIQVKENGQTQGSKTIIRSPTEDMLTEAKKLQDSVLILRADYKPVLTMENLGEVVEETPEVKEGFNRKGGHIYVKGNYVLTTPDGNAAYAPAIYSYNIFDDATINRDRDSIARSTVVGLVEQMMLHAASKDIIETLINKSLGTQEESGRFSRPYNNYFETGLTIYSGDLEKASQATLDLWKKTFYGLMGANAVIGGLDSSGNLDGVSVQAVQQGKRVVIIGGSVQQILVASGVQTANSLFFEKEQQNVNTGLTLNYREAAWGMDRILIDSVQNHLPKDSGATEVNVEFALKADNTTWLDISRLKEFSDDQIASVRIRDNGFGYDYQLLGLLHSTKTQQTDAAGGWGEGIKMLSAAAIRAGLGLELRSRNWQAKAVSREEFYRDANGKSIKVEALSYEMLLTRSAPLNGSQTIFTQLTPDFLTAVRTLPQKALALDRNYKPLSKTEGGEIVTTADTRIFVQGLEVQDATHTHNNILSYNFVNVPGIIVSPDRNVLHVGKVQEAIGIILAQTDSVDAVAKVIRTAIEDTNAYHPEYQDVTKITSYNNRATWEAAWLQLAKAKGWDLKKVVLGTSRTLFDPDAQILLRNMGYQVLFMNQQTSSVIHSLGVHLDAEVLEPKFEFVGVEQLTPQEQEVLKLREIIDRKLEEMMGVKIETSPLEIFTAVRSTLTGDELTGWHGYWNTNTEKIGIARSQLTDTLEFGMTYLEEMGHRLSQADDYTREFTEFFMNALVKEIFRQNGINFETRLANVSGTQRPTQNAVVANPAENSAENPGGIDLTAQRFNLDIRNQGGDFKFDIDPAKWQDVTIDGFNPVIINITPVADLPVFLSRTQHTPEPVQQLSMAK
jgi:hypothetical protein